MGDDYYLIAEEVHLSDLAQLVNNMMRAGEGWKPAGGIFINPHHGTFCQPMFKDLQTVERTIECFHCPDEGFIKVTP